ncbi:MAG: hypothetical protein Q9166_007457 [cf. Caloplaca sp. 2 TL-2023]
MTKIGDYKAQLAPEVEVLPGMFFGDDQFETIPSSQESVIEPDSLHLHGKVRSTAPKRPFIDGNEDEEEVGMNCAGRDAIRSIMDMSGLIALRPIAQARNRQRAATESKGACDGDFEEAPFLRDIHDYMEYGD